MSSSDSTPPKTAHWMVYAPDYTDAGALERRLAVRPVHLEKADGYIASGLTRVGGVLLSPESAFSSPEERKMVGSMFVCEAESVNVVKKRVETDIYYTSGVWDKEKIVILPVLMTPIPFPPPPKDQSPSL